MLITNKTCLSVAVMNMTRTFRDFARLHGVTVAVVDLLFMPVGTSSSESSIMSESVIA
jgi:hypothetical protein